MKDIIIKRQKSFNDLVVLGKLLVLSFQLTLFAFHSGQ